jgi:hypothetical protein
MRTLLAMALAAILPACAAPETGPSVPGGGVIPLEPRLASISAVIFVPRCASGACHSGTSGVPLDLSSAEAAFTSMVNAVSTQTDEFPVVAPFEPDRSYLMLRLDELLAGVGRMPPDSAGDPLTDDEVAAIRDWIANGAQND